MAQLAGDELAEPVIGQEDGGQDGQVARSPPCGLEDQHQGHPGDGQLQLVHPAAGLGDAGVVQDQVAEGEYGQQDQRQVPNRGQLPHPPLLPVGGVEQEGEGQQKDAVGGPQADGADGADGAVVELKDGPQAQQHRNGLVPMGPL